LLSTSQVPPSRENVPDVTRWFKVSISLILARCQSVRSAEVMTTPLRGPRDGEQRQRQAVPA
jgi:hypothetical protein